MDLTPIYIFFSCDLNIIESRWNTKKTSRFAFIDTEHSLINFLFVFILVQQINVNEKSRKNVFTEKRQHVTHSVSAPQRTCLCENVKLFNFHIEKLFGIL